MKLNSFFFFRKDFEIFFLFSFNKDYERNEITGLKFCYLIRLFARRLSIDKCRTWINTGRPCVCDFNRTNTRREEDDRSSLVRRRMSYVEEVKFHSRIRVPRYPSCSCKEEAERFKQIARFDHRVKNYLISKYNNNFNSLYNYIKFVNYPYTSFKKFSSLDIHKTLKRFLTNEISSSSSTTNKCKILARIRVRYVLGSVVALVKPD